MSPTAYFIAEFWLLTCFIAALLTHLRGKKGRKGCYLCDGDGSWETATGERFDCSCKGGA